MLGMSGTFEPRRIDMRTWSNNCAAVALLSSLLWGVLTFAALADVKDYEFQLVQSEMKKGDGAIVAVRLVNKKSGKPVPDAVIFAKRIDMAPDAMQEMTAPVEQLPSTEPGVYRFKTDLMMQGRWQLSLGAKVQGEEGTVEAKLILKALP
jgi:YtkA-like